MCNALVQKLKGAIPIGTLDTISVSAADDGPIEALISGHSDFPPASVSLSITASMSTTMVPGSSPVQHIPGLTIAIPALEASGLGPLQALFGLATGASALVGSIPTYITFRKPAFLDALVAGYLFSVLPTFPKAVPDWTRFGVKHGGLLGLATVSFQDRTQAMVGSILGGPASIFGPQDNLAGGATQSYDLSLSNLVPDTDKLTWSVTGPWAANGVLNMNPGSVQTSFIADFPLPRAVSPGYYRFVLRVDAKETSDVNPTQSLSTSTSKNVTVHVTSDATNVHQPQ